MKIAMIEQVCAHGGMDYYDYSLFKSLVSAGIDVSFYTSKAGVLFSNEVDFYETFKGVYGNRPKVIRGLIWVMAVRKTMADASRKGANIAHLHFFDTGRLKQLEAWFARRMGLKVVATIHDVKSFHMPQKKEQIARTLRILDGIIVHNETSREEVVSFLGGQSPKIAVIPHGHYIDYVGKRATKEDARARLRLSARSSLFLFFGQIKKVKGLDIAIRALADMRKSGSDAKLVVAGRTWKDDISNYMKLVKEMDLEENVIWRQGYIPNDRVDDYFYASDAVVLPYRRIYQSGVLLMAMSYGIPVIASDLDGMKEIIDHRENGLLFSADDYTALGEAMSLVSSDANFAHTLGIGGLEYVKKYHDWTEIGIKTAEFYKWINGGESIYDDR